MSALRTDERGSILVLRFKRTFLILKRGLICLSVTASRGTQLKSEISSRQALGNRPIQPLVLLIWRQTCHYLMMTP
jgi:hypothetical protein